MWVATADLPRSAGHPFYERLNQVLDEVFVKIQGLQQYLWRAVDEDGDVIDILIQSRRNRRAAARFFRKLLKGQGREPRRLVTDKLRSYAAAHHILLPSVSHSTRQYENNRAEVSHQPIRQRERQMRRFKSYVSTGSSVFEGFPNVFIQAAASSVPILSLEVDPGFVEATNCGYVAHGDLDRLAEVTMTLWHD